MKNQKLNSKLFQDKVLDEKMGLTSIQGGNKSDALIGGHRDSKGPTGYDIAVNSLIDFEPTSACNDKPTLVKPFPEEYLVTFVE
nr:hypothetical protein [uncultured Flavobacterium sp.]